MTEHAAPERVVTADGTTLAVRRLAGSGSLIVALHGFTGDGSALLPLVDAARRGRPALLVDLVGHGASDAPDHLEPYSMGSVVDQVLSVIGAQPVGTVHLLGYSMGGRVALSMAARAPWYFASITTISATAGIEDPTERAARYDRDQLLAASIEESAIDAFIEDWLALPLFDSYVAGLTPEARDATISQRTANSKLGLANSMRATGTGSMPPIWHALSSLRSPLLSIAGASDERYVGIAKDMSERAPFGRTAIVANVGHVAHAENCAEVAALFAQFLEVCENNEDHDR